MTRSKPIPLIVCDMTGALDTPAERLDEYRRLFAEKLIARERTERGIRFRFRDIEGTEEWVRDLAARENACCGFFDFDVSISEGEVRWDASVVDDDIARSVLEEFYLLADVEGADSLSVHARFVNAGLVVQIDDGDGGLRPVTPAELGLEQ
ncbi:MAG: hypothetical protein WD269_12000 [Acidimicrobiia bacterium]